MSFKNSLKGTEPYMNSCHASIERDFKWIWKYLGMTKGYGNWDNTYEERPDDTGFKSIETDHETKERINGIAGVDADCFKGADFIQIINPADFQERIKVFSECKPIVAYVNGQWLTPQLDTIVGHMNKQWEEGKVCNIALGVYTKVEETYIRERLHNELQERVHHIRFAKRKEDYCPWLFDDSIQQPARERFVFTSNHSIHHRPDSCMYPQWRDSVRDFPHILSGRHTEEILQDGGVGMLTFDAQKRYMQTCGVYLGVPCTPAPIVLNFIEAMMTGAPVAYFDNARGALQEEIFDGGVGCCSHDVGQIRAYLEKCLKDDGYRAEQSEKCMARAHEFFDFTNQSEKWGKLYDNLLNKTLQKA